MEYMTVEDIKMWEHTVIPGLTCNILEGSSNILVSAPHSVTHKRYDEASGTFAEKPSEIYTIALARLLNQHIGCHVFYNTNTGIDPNDDPVEEHPDIPVAPCEYKKNLEIYVKEYDIRFLVDIHLANPARPFDYELGTNEGINILNQGIITGLFSCIAGIHIPGVRVLIDEPFKAHNPNTISRYINKSCGIPALQIEINGNYFNIKKGTGYFEKTFRILCDYLNGIKVVAGDYEQYSFYTPVASSKHKPQNRVELCSLEGVINGGEIDIYNLEGKKETGTVVINKGIEPEKAGITERLLKSLFPKTASQLLLVHKMNYNKVSYSIPYHENIVYNKLLVSKDIYDSLDEKKKIIVYNSISGISGCFETVPYTDGKKATIFPYYYQRRLLEIDIFTRLDTEAFRTLSSVAGKAFIERCYAPVHNKEGNVSGYEIKPLDNDCLQELRDLCKKCLLLNNILYKPAVFPEDSPITQARWLHKAVCSKTLMLRSARSKETDDNIDVIRLTKNHQHILGVEENDCVIVTYMNRSAKVRVLTLEREDYARIIQINNGVIDINYMDMVVCIPFKIRTKLCMYRENAGVVSIERDMKSVIKKNIFLYVMTFIGIFIALLELKLPVWITALSVMGLSFFFIYLILSVERNKVNDINKE